MKKYDTLKCVVKNLPEMYAQNQTMQREVIFYRPALSIENIGLCTFNLRLNR